MTAATHCCSAERSDHATARQFGLATWIIGSTSTDAAAAAADDDDSAGN